MIQIKQNWISDKNNLSKYKMQFLNAGLIMDDDQGWHNQLLSSRGITYVIYNQDGGPGQHRWQISLNISEKYTL